MRYKYIYRPSASDYITAKEAAELLRVEATTIRRWCSSGKLKAKKIGKSWIIDRREIEEAS